MKEDGDLPIAEVVFCRSSMKEADILVFASGDAEWGYVDIYITWCGYDALVPSKTTTHAPHVVDFPMMDSKNSEFHSA